MVDLSRLPEDIIHHILSLLETKQAVRTSMCCKTWYSAWLTCPTLNFGEWIYNPSRRKQFIKFINGTLKRYQDQNLRIEKFVLGMIIYDSPASLVDEWVGIAVQNGVEKLELNLDDDDSPHPYNLLGNIFGAKSLRELTVSNMDVSLNLKTQIHDKVMFNNLQKLHLDNIIINDELFHDILSRCTLIEDLYIRTCEGLKRIEVTSLQNLKKLTIRAWWYQLHHVGEVKAPRLRYLSLENIFNLGPCFDNWGHRFPQLEYLKLVGCNGVERIDISNHSLKRIKLIGMRDLKEVKVDAPSGVLFKIQSSIQGKLPDIISFTNTPRQSIVQIHVSSFSDGDTFQICELKKFLAKLISPEISLEIFFDADCGFDDPEGSIPIIEAEILSMRGHCGRIDFGNILDGLLLVCHPKAITFGGGEAATRLLRTNIIKWLNLHETKPWFEHLKKVKFESYEGTKDEWHPCGCGTCLWHQNPPLASG